MAIGYLSKRPNGMYILTGLQPVKKEVGSSGDFDLYPKPGDPYAWAVTICDWARKEMFNVEDLETFECVRINFNGEEIAKPFRILETRK